MFNLGLKIIISKYNMNINIKQNKKPKLCMPSFNVDNELSSKLNEYEISKLMNRSNFTLYLGRSGSEKLH